MWRFSYFTEFGDLTTVLNMTISNEMKNESKREKRVTQNLEALTTVNMTTNK